MNFTGSLKSDLGDQRPPEHRGEGGEVTFTSVFPLLSSTGRFCLCAVCLVLSLLKAFYCLFVCVGVYVGVCVWMCVRECVYVHAYVCACVYV